MIRTGGERVLEWRLNTHRQKTKAGQLAWCRARSLDKAVSKLTTEMNAVISVVVGGGGDGGTSVLRTIAEGETGLYFGSDQA